MAGKSNKGRNRRGSHNAVNSSEPAVSSDVPLNDNLSPSEPSEANSNGNMTMSESISTQFEVKQSENANSENQAKQGELHLYTVSVKTQGGEKLELQLSPGDSVMDIRQFLLDAPETCFFTCYDLLLHAKDGLAHQLEDFNEISEVADITTGDCSLEMVAALYDDRSIRAHVHRTRELLSLSTLHSSLSTSLALQHETGKSTPANSGDSAKTEVPELDSLGFMEDVTGSLTNLLSSPSKEIKCVESIVFSSFNPPPSYRRLVGDLIYLDAITLEGNKFCITGTTQAFYVNSSVGNVLDPRPSKAVSESATLIGLLQKISPKFKKAFREILERKASAHPFENVQSLLPPNSWLGLYPLSDHKRDAARAENALTLTFGSELIGMQRDWNEELQSCREFPHTNPQERILRDRALYKVTSDFVDAAISGAIGVINRCIPPINPTDPECFHMYVHNNIFFSFAVDPDLEQLSRKRATDANLKIESTSSLNNSSEKTVNKLSPAAASVSSGDKSNYPSTENLDCSTHLASDVPAEPQLTESEQATYASANNDLKGTKAYQEADVSGLYNLAMAIIDYRGHRVVAQSVLPGILQGDKSDSLLYGSVDNGKKICWNEDFHSKVLEAAKRLHLKEHAIFDGSGNVFKLAAPVECKGIVGSDDRHYLLDLMRVTPRDANYTGPGSRFCILRPELISGFCQAEAAERPKNSCKTKEEHPGATDSPVDGAEGQVITEADTALATSDTQDVSKEGKHEAAQECCPASIGDGDRCDEISFNPNAFTEFKLAGSQEEITADEENVRKASLYLRDVVLPKFIQDLCTLEVSPMDGQTLTDALHTHGINVRYIGKVAEGTKNLPHLWDLCSNEIVVRSAKHILKDALRESEDHDVGRALSHFFNCFFGNCQAAAVKVIPNGMQSKAQKKDHAGHQASGKSSRGQARWKNGGSSRKKQSCLNITSDSLWSDIEEFAKTKYQFELPEDARSRVKKISVIRNLCQKVGISIAAHKYDLDAAAPFQISDILDLRPVVKHSIPVCSETRDLVETGKVQLAEGMLSEAYTLFSEAFTILQQVTGPMHREVANCCRYLAMVLYHAGDMAGAIIQQHKELIINERCLGLDHPDTAHSYGNMALFYHGLNQTELALRHMSRALLLLSLSSGPDHPDVAATFINVAMMYQDIGNMNTALRYLQEALKKNERLLGEEHIQTAVCYHALAIAFSCMGAFKLSHQHEKKTYDILVKQLGEEDSRTRDSQNLMKIFKMHELNMNAQKQKGQTLNADSFQKAIDSLKAHPDLNHLIQAIQAADAAGGSGNSGASANKTRNSAIIGEALPRGRGVDERAARAAAEARKKAAARGLLIRPHGVPVQALPPLTQFLNIINSGMTPDASNNTETDGIKKEANGHVSNGRGETQEDQSKQGQQDQAPVGLGTGLAALDSKKQKTKPKVAA
ncbi:Clustered mitochondria protein [Actinidia chinensis var. chinensis]|uniref:Clustered mitochondria protein homolog n=1 Tax=Actinidia chinensis var. chinensis TaxID=1590841 RepID=A0A2R6RAB1_ACTCC|nr:Clustered mitochondria protein [Actinidia chinensis var. chinensis]